MKKKTKKQKPAYSKWKKAKKPKKAYNKPVKFSSPKKALKSFTDDSFMFD